MAEDFRISLSPEAATDLEAIYAYIAMDSKVHARRMVERILSAIDKLKAAPHRTVLIRQSTMIKYPVRTLPIQAYLIYFRVLPDERLVRILTIRHGARRRPRQFPSG